MTSVRFRVNGALKTSNSATLRLLGSSATPIRLPWTNPQAVYDNLHGNWQELARPGLKPFNKRVGDNLHTLQVTVTIAPADGGVRDPAGSAQDIIDALVDAANADSPASPVVFTWGPFSSSARLTQTGHWHIDSFTLNSTWMDPSSNRVSQATAQITLKEACDEPGAADASSSYSSAGAAPTAAPDLAGQANVGTWTVRAGDTAYSIASAVYGAAEPGWRYVLSANGISDPRALAAGQVLVFP